MSAAFPAAAVVATVGLRPPYATTAFLQYYTIRCLAFQRGQYGRDRRLSAFSTTLMMVGAISFPLEKTYLGTRLALCRNAISFVIAILVALATGLYFGELL